MNPHMVLLLPQSPKWSPTWTVAPSILSEQQSSRFLINTRMMRIFLPRSTPHQLSFSCLVQVQVRALHVPLQFPSTAYLESPMIPCGPEYVEDWAVGCPSAQLGPPNCCVQLWASPCPTRSPRASIQGQAVRILTGAGISGLFLGGSLVPGGGFILPAASSGSVAFRWLGPSFVGLRLFPGRLSASVGFHRLFPARLSPQTSEAGRLSGLARLLGGLVLGRLLESAARHLGHRPAVPLSRLLPGSRPSSPLQG